jgi:hypothetical protein
MLPPPNVPDDAIGILTDAARDLGVTSHVPKPKGA